MLKDQYNYSGRCPIWLDTTAKFSAPTGDFKSVSSSRAGGRYRISGTAEAMLLNRSDMFRAKLTTWLVTQRTRGIYIPQIPPRLVDTSDFFDQIEERELIPFSKRRENFFKFLNSMSPSFDFVFRFSENKKDQENRNLINAYIEARNLNSNELSGLCELLAKNGYIKYDNSAFSITLEQKGWEYLEIVSSERSISDNAFVAMWFHEDLTNVYNTQIEKALEECGYKSPFRIDRIEHTNKIDDEIVARINQSSLVVVDLTCRVINHQTSESEIEKVAEARGGVYFEAGYAMGLDIPIVWTCQKNSVEHIHFDTRQYNQIVWYEDGGEYWVGDGTNKLSLRDALVNRITAIKKNRSVIPK